VIDDMFRLRSTEQPILGCLGQNGKTLFYSTSELDLLVEGAARLLYSRGMTVQTVGRGEHNIMPQNDVLTILRTE
jgi:hypothetical protein